MSRETLVSEIGEWLVDQALSEPDIVTMFDQVCHKLYAIGVPVRRARLTWPTLHPLFTAETIMWHRGQETEFEQFRHQEQASDAWNASPMKYMLETGNDVLRRNLDGPNRIVDFPVLSDLIELGMTDYLLIATSFERNQDTEDMRGRGLFVSWASDREGGFSDDDLLALKRIQRRFAAACKSVVQTRIARNITETYLGRQAGGQVLEGAIRLGDGHETKALVWYSDMRNSTSLADTMEPRAFLDMLNEYFDATAGAAIAHGGEVLDFIGDAVLAIFPFEGPEGRKTAVRAATRAVRDALSAAEKTNAARKERGLIAFDFGVAMNIGKVMFGNIGVASRLSFSVIGPTVNEVERIEKLTKALQCPVLVSADVASAEPDLWHSHGFHQLIGVSQECELFGLSEHATNHAAPRAVEASATV
ncbi:MAG: adenylate/guanylate cyclase domain-containing protein [Pseudomonadota bacterium]